MVVMARARQTTAAGTAGAARSGTHPSAARPGAHPSTARHLRHTSTLSSKEITTRQLTLLIVQGSMVGCVILAVLAFAYAFFGNSITKRFEPSAASAGGASGTGSPSGTTVLYRDRGDGTVLVLEIDGNGTRIKGTLDRKDVPMIREKRERRKLLDEETISSQSRIHALGSAFR